jgi:hypothetical protein
MPLRTSARATDILMDRVWQLEMETFLGTPGFVFSPMTNIVEPAEDPTALPPGDSATGGQDKDRSRSLLAARDQQSGATRLRVGRKACRANPGRRLQLRGVLEL